MIKEIRGREHADQIRALNGLEPSFPALSDKHINEGYWWFAYDGEEIVGFAGLVENVPFIKTGYMKRAYVLPEHRGKGLQGEFLAVRALKAQKLGWNCLVSECHVDNKWSAENFRRAGYTRCIPEQPWAVDSIFWTKRI